MKNTAPTFPPLLSGHRLEAGKNPFSWSCSRAAKAKLGAGDIVWSEDTNSMRFALVMEPDVERARCPEMLYLLMVAFGDAGGALCPPEISIQYQWPSSILMNGAKIGAVNLKLSDEETNGIPDWMVIGIEVELKPEKIAMNPGETENQTTFWDEGCGDITRTQLLESAARHCVNWIHTWSEDGFKPVYDNWWERVFPKAKLASLLEESGDLIGLDENGNALIAKDGATTILQTINALGIIASGRS